MRLCPHCNNKALKLKNIFTLKYECQSCNALWTSTTAHKAVANVLINLLPVVGIILAVVFNSLLLFLLGAVALPIALCCWHQNRATLIGFSR
ncbi:MAG TPA: hypothetical protein VIC26_07905 [Marinagarivorans sp.]